MADIEKGIFDLVKETNLYKREKERRDDAKKNGEEIRTLIDGLELLTYEHIRAVIAEVADVIPEYNPYLYESLLKDTARLIDRCLAFRKECIDIEAQWVRQLLEYELFDLLAPEQETLNKLITSTTALLSQATAYDQGSKDFGNDALAPGFKTIYAGSASSINLEAQNQAEKLKSLSAILKAQESHQALLRERHTTLGHPLNYQWRRGQLLLLLSADLKVAYLKAKAAAAGIKAQLNVVATVAFPEITNVDKDDTNLLDQFALWLRSLANQYEAYSKNEAGFEVTIPLVSAWKFAGKTPASLKSVAAFTAAMKSNGLLIDLDLASALPTENQVKNLRLVGVGLSAGLAGSKGIWNFDKMPSGFLISWSAMVFAPAQPDPLRENQKVVRPPARIVGIASNPKDARLNMADGDEVRNIDPRSGTWGIAVDALDHFPSAKRASKWPRGFNRLADLKIHLRLLGCPSANIDDWKS